MADGTVGVAQSSSPDRLIDNDTGTVGGETVYRQRVWDMGPIGTWGYQAGASGTVAVTGTVLSVAVHATSAGSFTINGGDSVVVPANTQFALAFRGGLVDPTFVFTSTDSYFVEKVT